MNCKEMEIVVSGQKNGSAKLITYILDAISVDENKKRPAVVICPGGGYSFCSDREGEPIAIKFMEKGYHAFVLKYSVRPNVFPTALAELAEGISLIRENSEKWNVDKEKIIVCGFSAGGHLACSLGVFWDKDILHNLIPRKKEEYLPNGIILGYPVITAGESAHIDSIQNLIGEKITEEKMKNQVSLEKHVTKNMPKVFVWHTLEDATVPIENSFCLIDSLRKNNIEFEFHVYPKGNHGLSLANDETSGKRKELIVPSVQSWMELANNWIENL